MELTAMNERELKEVLHALFYEQHCNHGTTGHNQLMLIAKLAKGAGFALSDDNSALVHNIEGASHQFRFTNAHGMPLPPPAYK